MKTLLAVVTLVAVLAAPSFGVLNVSLQMGGPGSAVLDVGQTGTVEIWAQETNGGLVGLAGSIVASGTPSTLHSVPGSFLFDTPFGGGTPFPSDPGTPGSNGGWNHFVSVPPFPFPEPIYFQPFVLVATYQVETLQPGTVTLSFVKEMLGWQPPGPWDPDSLIGTFSPLTVTVVPEPASMVLLALAGLAMLRRRK